MYAAVSPQVDKLSSWVKAHSHQQCNKIIREHKKKLPCFPRLSQALPLRTYQTTNFSKSRGIYVTKLYNQIIPAEPHLVPFIAAYTAMKVTTCQLHY